VFTGLMADILPAPIALGGLGCVAVYVGAVVVFALWMAHRTNRNLEQSPDEHAGAGRELPSTGIQPEAPRGPLGRPAPTGIQPNRPTP
jgi:hypothetical protein